MAADIVSRGVGININRIKYNALTSVAALGGQRILLLKPQTYMNRSGSAVKQAMRFYKVPLSNVVVICDDVSLPVGKLRVRRSGSSGGHNGLKDIIAKCGGENFPRIKIGVGAPEHEDYDMADWVLSKLSDEDEKLIEAAALQSAAALELIIIDGIEKAMAKFN